jgi:glycosyltransferase involved in cell wall biosynthesis
VLHGKTGFVVPPGDANALAQAMIQLMNLPADERRAMGDAGRTHVMANFEIEQVVSRWEALYCEWIERKTRR